MIELTHRQHQVYDGIRARMSPGEIADAMGVTLQYVTQLRSELRDLGVIRLRGDLPSHGRYEDVYPWEMTSDQPPVYKPAIPPRARLRLVYPQDARRDLTVPPIRQLWWPDPEPRWSVQGIAMARADGRKPKDALPNRRVVVVTALPCEQEWCITVPARQPWTREQTVSWLAPPVTIEEIEPMTLLIAAAIGVDSVYDLEGE